MCVKCMFAGALSLSSHSRLMSLLWISRIFACFTLSVSPCLPPPPLPLLFCFPPSIFIAPCHPNSIHSSLSDQREGAFFSLSLLLLRGSADGIRARPVSQGPSSAAAGHTRAWRWLPACLLLCCITFQHELFISFACTTVITWLSFVKCKESRM